MRLALSIVLAAGLVLADDEWATGIAQTEVVRGGLVGYWSMRTDGNATQVVGEVSDVPMNTGTYGQPNLVTSGIVGAGCSFITNLLATSEGLRTATVFTNVAPFSVFSWANLRTGATICILSTYNASSVGWTLDATTSVGSAHVRFSNATGTNNFLRTYGAHGLGTLANQWACWGIVADATTLTLYCNGRAMTSVAQNVMTHTNALIVGWRPDSSGDFDNRGGKFDEIRTYSRAVSADEAHEIYRAGQYLRSVP